MENSINEDERLFTLEEGIPHELYLERMADFKKGENIISWEDLRNYLASKNISV